MAFERCAATAHTCARKAWWVGDNLKEEAVHGDSAHETRPLSFFLKSTDPLADKNASEGTWHIKRPPLGWRTHAALVHALPGAASRNAGHRRTHIGINVRRAPISISPQSLVVQADTQEMPNVDDYIAQKAAVYQLQQHMANWERKV